MEIGKLSLELVERELSELDAELIGLTGHAAAEIRTILAYPCIAGTVAAALLPLLAEPVARHALAEAIDKAGVHEVRERIRAIYDEILTAEQEADQGEAEAVEDEASTTSAVADGAAAAPPADPEDADDEAKA